MKFVLVAIFFIAGCGYITNINKPPPVTFLKIEAYGNTIEDGVTYRVGKTKWGWVYTGEYCTQGGEDSCWVGKQEEMYKEPKLKYKPVPTFIAIINIENNNNVRASKGKKGDTGEKGEKGDPGRMGRPGKSAPGTM